MLPAPHFHAESGAVRFWILIDGAPMGASIGKTALFHHFRRGVETDEPLAIFRAHSPAIEAAVRRRAAQGSIEPVMLREFDLREPPEADGTAPASAG